MKSYPIFEYQIGIVCALWEELKAVRAILDEEHAPLKQNNDGGGDNNSYVLGKVGDHNVVAAGLPLGTYGIGAATSVARDMVRTFPHLRFGLLVGIAGGIPDIQAKRDIRLGDVVVSVPTGDHGGVLQYDFVKDHGGGYLEQRGALDKPPKVLRTALTNLRADTQEDPIPQYLMQIDERFPSLRHKGYCHPGVDKDALYCHRCDPSKWWWILWVLLTWFWPFWRCEDCDNCKNCKVRRPPRSHTQPVIHYGTIASANTLLRNVKRREHLKTQHGALCVEMEAAGLTDEFPCLVIRGICDYADSYKNDVWHEYAALTAAVFAKKLLRYVSPQTTQEEKSIRQVLSR